MTNLNDANVTVIDGADNSTTTVAAGTAPRAVAVNPVTNKIYVANEVSGNVTAIDGADNSTTTVAAGTSPGAVAVSPMTNKIYVANFSSANVTVIDEQRDEANPLRTAIVPFANDRALTTTPTFDFLALAWTGAGVRQIFYQVDTWIGVWLRATPDGAMGGGVSPALTPGMHTVFAFAVDGQEATSINAGKGSSPILGPISAHHFLVAPPIELDVSDSALGFGSQDIAAGPTGPMTLSLTNIGEVDLTFKGTEVALGGADAGLFAISSDSGEGSLDTGTTRTLMLTFDPDSAGEKSADLTITSDDEDEPLMFVTLSGVGIDREVDVAPGGVAFGNREIDSGATAASAVTITNMGLAPLSIWSVTLGGADASEFAISADTGETILAPSGVRTVRLSFNPSAEGSKMASLRITSDDTTEPTSLVSLFGIGLLATPVPTPTATPTLTPTPTATPKPNAASNWRLYE